VDAIRWLADTERGRALPADAAERAARLADPARLLKPELFSFQRVSEAQQAALRQAEPQRIWMGPHPGTDLAGWARSQPGCRALFPLCPYPQLREDTWPAYRDSGRAASSAQVTVMPGYDLLDDEGVRSAVVSPEVFPKHVLRYPNSTLLENVWLPVPDCLSVLRTPLQNRIPRPALRRLQPDRVGSHGGVGAALPAAGGLQVLHRAHRAGRHAGRRGRADVGAGAARRHRGRPVAAQPPHHVRHQRAAPADVHVGGPRAHRRRLGGPLVRLPARRAGGGAPAHVADAPLTEVMLYDGEQVLRRSVPGPEFAVRLRLTLWRDRALHVTARDAAGGRLHATYPLYTRNLDFWGHVGSDQMNNYVNAMAPSPRGFLGVRGEMVDMFGFVTLGAGWGDYLRITPAIRYSDFMPRQEISLVIGSFNIHHPSALLGAGPDLLYLNDHRRVFSFCGRDAQWFRSVVAGQHLDNESGREQTWHGRTVRPTRLFLPVPEAQGEDEYVVWRWRAGAPILVEVRKHLRVEPRRLAGDWLTFASNAHHLLPGLTARAAAGAAVTIADLPASPVRIEPHKEWDNSHYLREGAADTGSILPAAASGQVIIGHGGVGTFFMMPLGTPRAYRCLLHRTDREVQVYFQCHLAPEECSSGRFTVSYLAALDSSESYEDSFNALARHIDLNGHAFSSVLDLNGVLPPALDLDEVFPALRGHALWLEVRGLPGGLIEWRDERGLVCFCSQPMEGRSFHRLAADAPRRYRLVSSMELRVEAVP
jgi:hypothetical protein